MRIRNWFVVVVTILSMGSFSWAQATAAQNPAGETAPTQGTQTPREAPPAPLSGIMGMDTAIEQEDTSAILPHIPSVLGGAGPTLEFSAEQERTNYLRGGINVGATYDDNTSLVPAGAVSNTTYSVFPDIRIEQTFPRMRWDLGYAAGLTVNQRLSNRNQGSHAINFDSQFRLSPHVNLRAAEVFSLTTGLFDSGTSIVAGLPGSNGTPIAPLSKQRNSSTTGELDYHFKLKDLMGFSGTFDDLHFSDQGTASLVNTRAESGAAFWLHGFGRNWLGITYRFQHIGFTPTEGSSGVVGGTSDVHSILALNTTTLPSHFTFTAFAGPQYSDNHGVLPDGDTSSNFTDWSFAGGVELDWQTQRSGMTVGYSRQISSGAGLLGVSRVQGVHGGFRQQLFPGWAVAVSGSYGRNEALTIPVAGGTTSIDAATVGASLERNLGRSLTLRLGYNHDFQDQTGTTDTTLAGNAHRNRYFVTVGYQWTRPLGR